MSVDKLYFNTTANVDGEWFINKNLDFAYFSTFTSDFVLSDTSTNVDNNPWSAMNALTSLRAPILLWDVKRSVTHTMLSLKYHP